MRRLAISFVLLCFAATFLSNSMFMLSIERGRVHTESFNLNHIINSTHSFTPENIEDRHVDIGNSRFLSHLHIQLSRYSIPGKRGAAVGPELSLAESDLFPPSAVFAGSLPVSLSKMKSVYGSRLKLPISPLQQSSALLI